MMEKTDGKRPLIITGSARKESDTLRLVQRLFSPQEARVLNLLDYPLDQYNYAGNYSPHDTFDQLVAALLEHEVLVVATPVYWYSMSGYMKVFFDRLTDLVTIKKKIGRQLKGKKMFMIAVGNSELLPEGFEVPFRLTAEYLDMAFIASCYCSADQLDGVLPAAFGEFKQKVMAFAAKG